MVWLSRAVAVLGLAVVGWVGLTSWSAVVHGHPAYAVMLGVTVLVSLLSLWHSWHRRRGGIIRTILRILVLLVALGWLAIVVWLKPFGAIEPALTAMVSDSRVTVTESATGIVLAPTGATTAPAVLFQPGARVDARAYAAVLRPLAEAGHLVVIPKQPLGIAFLATTAFEWARDAHPEQTAWVVGGHSLGGTVAALDADAHAADSSRGVVGLLLYASYPANDLSTMPAAALSVSGSLDGLATPADIAASRSNLPTSARFTVVPGAVHASFGDYGPQPGDGVPTLDQDASRSAIARATLDWLAALR